MVTNPTRRSVDGNPFAALLDDDTAVKSPSKLLLWRTGEGVEPDADKLADLIGRAVQVVRLRPLLTTLREESRPKESRRAWEVRFRQLVNQDHLVVLGPLEDLIVTGGSTSFEIEENGRLSRRLQRQLCSMTSIVSPRHHNVIFYSYANPKSLGLEWGILKRKIKYGHLFSKEMDLVTSVWSNNLERYKASVDPIDAIDRELSNIVENALRGNKAKMSDEDRASLVRELTGSLVGVLSHRLESVLSTLDVVDPLSGLVVPPGPRSLYTDRSGDEASLNAPKFLKKIWGDYLEAGLLYAGHLKKIDQPLYNAIIYVARQTARGKAEVENREWNTKDTSDILFTKYGIVTEEQLNNPPPNLIHQVSIIDQARAKQKIPLRLRLVGDAKGFREKLSTETERSDR